MSDIRKIIYNLIDIYEERDNITYSDEFIKLFFEAYFKINDLDGICYKEMYEMFRFMRKQNRIYHLSEIVERLKLIAEIIPKYPVRSPAIFCMNSLELFNIINSSVNRLNFETFYTLNKEYTRYNYGKE